MIYLDCLLIDAKIDRFGSANLKFSFHMDVLLEVLLWSLNRRLEYHIAFLLLIIFLLESETKIIQGTYIEVLDNMMQFKVSLLQDLEKILNSIPVKFLCNLSKSTQNTIKIIQVHISNQKMT